MSLSQESNSDDLQKRLRSAFKPAWRGIEWLVAEEMLSTLNELLTSNNIRYTLAYGTLLGSQRSKTVIPWDDDIDIAIFDDGEEKLKQLAPELRKRGFVTSVLNKNLDGFKQTIYKLSVQNSKPIAKGLEWSWPFVDIFVIRKQGEMCQLEKQPFPRHYVENIVPSRFGRLTLSAPATPDLAQFLYGDDCLDICHSSPWNHRLEIPIELTWQVPLATLLKQRALANVVESAYRLYRSKIKIAPGNRFADQALPELVDREFAEQVWTIFEVGASPEQVMENRSNADAPKITRMDWLARLLNTWTSSGVVGWDSLPKKAS